jgi:hypothetical protein
MPAPGPVDDAAVRWIVTVATRAPSVHNTQPWRFTWDGRQLDLHADLSRRLAVIDPDGRQLVLSCGAALAHARLAIRTLGRSFTVAALPDPARPDLLARVTIGPVTGEPPAMADWRMLWAVPSRHTVRGPLDATALPADLRGRLVAVSQCDEARLRFVDAPADRRIAARLVECADRAQEAQATFRTELAAWTRETVASDGLPPWAVSTGWLTTPGEFRLRNFDVRGVARRPSPYGAHDHSALAVLHTTTDTPGSWLSAGEALARVLLTATCADVRASMLDQPIEIEGSRDALRQSLRLDGHPQVLLRLGYAPPGLATPRRPVDEILDNRGP